MNDFRTRKNGKKYPISATKKQEKRYGPSGNWTKPWLNVWKNKKTGTEIMIDQPYTDSNKSDSVIIVNGDMYAYRKPEYPFSEHYDTSEEAEKDVWKYIENKQDYEPSTPTTMRGRTGRGTIPMKKSSRRRY